MYNALIAVDMSQSWDWKTNISEVVLPKSNNPQTGSPPPIVIDGALYQGGPGDKNIYLYGGTTSFWNTSFPNWQSPTSFQYSLWSFDTVAKTWAQYDVSNASPVRPSGGAWADAPNLNLAFYLGGKVDNGSQITTGDIGGGIKVGLLGMVVIDTKSQTAKNVSTAGLTGDSPRSRGNLVYVPEFGDKGILVTLGGSFKSLSDQNDKVVGTLVPMDTIEVFDVASLDGGKSGYWYKQKASGDIPEPRIDACVALASAPDGSSHNIYLYGGRNATGIFDQIFVLSLPSFTWTKIFEGKSPRYGMTCHLVGKRQLLTVGGYSSLNLTSGCDWEDKGVGIYDLSTLIWGSRYFADAKEYTVPTPVVSMIGGNPPSSSTPPPTSTPPSKGAIAGGVIGGVAALSMIVGAIIYFIRRRRGPRPASVVAPAELSGSPFDAIQEKDASHPRPDVDAELGAHSGHYAELEADRGVEIMGYTQKSVDAKDEKDERDKKGKAEEQDYKDVPMI
ncbi:hypothetical protein FGG08_004614 [Glutinoglossum americanum]|uniref:Kelch repeat-containing protein n=1 Tax=Glutinoglossum americanum TaxID=1670608 RepID=A0A9P8I775_9PEZI|nr:hypothetical protein FGG08_004614 [Glutinoglossum americanum]